MTRIDKTGSMIKPLEHFKMNLLTLTSISATIISISESSRTMFVGDEFNAASKVQSQLLPELQVQMLLSQ